MINMLKVLGKIDNIAWVISAVRNQVRMLKIVNRSEEYHQWTY